MDFPYLPAEADFEFPSCMPGESLVAAGGNLSPGMLISAYRRGIFPWYNDDTQPIMWHSPDPRFVLFPDQLHLGKKFRSFMKKQSWIVRLDHNFSQMIACCAAVPRAGQNGTWITKNMQQAYIKLHELGFAHSCEVYDEQEEFIGGFYGINLRKIFFGESMVSLKTQVSRYALAKFIQYFLPKGLKMIDCQQETEYLGSMGAQSISRDEFLSILAQPDTENVWRGNWAHRFSDFA